MRLLFLNRSFWPDPEATGQLLTELCTDLARDHDVTVVAGPSYHVRTAGRGLWQEDAVGAVRIVRTWGTRLPKRHLASRLINLGTYYALAACAALRQRRPDVVVAETDPPLLGLLGAALKARWGCRFLYYCQDVYPDVAEATGGVRSAPLLAALRWGNRRAYDAADRIVVLGRDMRQRLFAKGIPSDKLSVRPNWVDCQLIRPLPRNPFRNQLGARFVVMYSGNLGLSQPLDVVLDAAARLRGDERFLFVFIGEGASKGALEAQATALGLRNVRFLGYQAKERLSESLGAGDLHVIPLRAGLEGCLVPSKVYGVLAAGRPFVAMMNPEAEVAALAREFEVGFVVPPGDADALAHVVRRAAADQRLLDTMGARARRLAEERFDRPIATREFAALLDGGAGIDGKPAGDTAGREARTSMLGREWKRC